MQPRLFDESTHNVLPRDGEAALHLDVIGEARGEALCRALHETLPWQQHDISIFGRTVLEPRLSAWVGDAAYRYSGRLRKPEPWTTELVELRELCGQVAGARFNSVLCNLYRDGSDSMGWHSDDERDLGERPTIASMSLGAERRFRFRHRETKDVVTLDLPSRSVLVMAGECQRWWQHSVSKTTREVEPRINLTFRYIVEDPTAHQA